MIRETVDCVYYLCRMYIFIIITYIVLLMNTATGSLVSLLRNTGSMQVDNTLPQYCSYSVQIWFSFLSRADPECGQSDRCILGQLIREVDLRKLYCSVFRSCSVKLYIYSICVLRSQEMIERLIFSEKWIINLQTLKLWMAGAIHSFSDWK